MFIEAFLNSIRAPEERNVSTHLRARTSRSAEANITLSTGPSINIRSPLDESKYETSTNALDHYGPTC